MPVRWSALLGDGRGVQDAAVLSRGPLVKMGDEVGAVIGKGKSGITPAIGDWDGVALMAARLDDVPLATAIRQERFGNVTPLLACVHLDVSGQRHVDESPNESKLSDRGWRHKT